LPAAVGWAGMSGATKLRAMSSYSRPSSLERLVGACLGLLVAAVAVYVAVRLIESVWPVLVGLGVGMVGLAGLVTVLRWRRQGW